jgi:hypothetical protein
MARRKFDKSIDIKVGKGTKMLKWVVRLCLLFVAVAPLQAWGRPVIVTEYKENFMNDTEEDAKCGHGWSVTKITNADCIKKTLPGGVVCYSCSCPSSYNLDSCPAHGICSECNGKKRLDDCADFWAMNADRNTCSELCKNYNLSACPANAACYKCKAGTVYRYKFKNCNAGYGLVGDHCELSHTHAYECPEGYSEVNSWGDEAETVDKICSCNAVSGTCYKAPSCVEGGSKECSGSIAVCVGEVEVSRCVDCTGAKRYTCRPIVCADEGKKECNGECIETSECCGGCAEGSSCVNGDCVDNTCRLPDCVDSVAEKPANSYFVQEACTDCQGSHTIKTDWKCNAGYEKSGNVCKEICIPLADDVGCVGETQKCVDGCGGTRKCCKTCVAGGSPLCSGTTVSCSPSQVQMATCTDCGGTPHYSCRNKTCAEQNLKDCNGSCIGLNECCGGCGDGYHCSNSTCVAD